MTNLGNAMRRRGLLMATAAVLSGVACAARAQAPVTIVYSDWQLAEPVSSKPLLASVAAFEQQNPGIKVTPQPVAQGSRDVIYTTAMRAGQGPDVFVLDANPVQQYAQQGFILDLTPYLAQEQGGAQGYLSDFFPQAVKVDTVDGKVYGIPHDHGNTLLYSNLAMFKGAGIAAPPKTWDEFRADAQKLTRASQPGGPVDQWAYAMPILPDGFNNSFPAFLAAFGASLLTPDFKHSAILSPATKAAINFLVDLDAKDKVMPPGVIQMGGDPPRHLLIQNKLAFIANPFSLIANLGGIDPKFDAYHALIATPMPSNPQFPSEFHSIMGVRALFINSHAKHPEEAWKFVKFMLQSDQLDGYFLGSGQLPSRRSMDQSDPSILKDPFAAAHAADLSHATVVPQTPKWPQVLEIMRVNLSAAFSGTKTTDQALNDANAAIEAALQQ